MFSALYMFAALCGARPPLPHIEPPAAVAAAAAAAPAAPPPPPQPPPPFDLPAAVVGGGVGRGHGGGRRRGFRHTVAARAKMATAKMKGSLAKARGVLHRVGTSGLQNNIVGVFHERAQHLRKYDYQLALVGDSSIHVPVDTRTHDQNVADRIVASHVVGQSSIISQWLTPPLRDERGQAKQFTNVVNVFDDASMWVSVPPTNTEKTPVQELADSAVDAVQRKRLLQRQSKARMAHCPVLNVCQTIFKQIFPPAHVGVARSPFDQLPSTRSLSLHVPAQVLPVANYSTVGSRWKRWGIFNGTPTPGVGIDPEGKIRDALGQVPRGSSWTNLCIVKDCLAVNGNIVHEVVVTC